MTTTTRKIDGDEYIHLHDHRTTGRHVDRYNIRGFHYLRVDGDGAVMVSRDGEAWERAERIEEAQ